MAKRSVTTNREEINGLLEDIWRIQEHLTAAQRSLEDLENRVAAYVPDED